MKLNKRILSLILVIVMVLGLVPMATATDDAAATCAECQSVGGHTAGCSQYVIPTCDECHGDLIGEKAGHSTACSHYVAPETDPAPASVEGTEGTTGTTTEGTTVGTTAGTTEGTTEGTTVATTEGTTAPTTEAATEATTAPTTQETTEATSETTEATTVVNQVISFKAARADTASYAGGMTQIKDINNRVFYLVLNRNYYAVTDNVVTADYSNGITSFERKSVSEADAKAAKELNVAGLTKWMFVPADTDGEFYVKSVSSGKFMRFNERGVAEMVDEGVPTKVYGVITEGSVTTNDNTSKTYRVLYAFVQKDAAGVEYVLNQYGGASFNGFAGYPQGSAYETDVGNLFLMKEAYYEAPSDIKILDNTTAMNAVIKVFNYDATINNYNAPSSGKEFQFYQSSGYVNKMSTVRADPWKDGTYDGKTQMATMKPVLINGYPESVEFGSFEYLFKENTAYHKGTMTDGGYLFQQKDNYYVYDSIDNAAWYDQANNKFVLYDLAISPSYTQTYYLDINFETTAEANEAIGAGKGIETHANDVQSGNFLPFNRITTETAFNEGTKQITGVPRYSLKPDTQNDMWFGLTTEFDFYMPEDGKKNGSDMIFDFTGDDDVWVYIDDVLILDIGGTHGALNGFINFATGEVEYSYANDGTKTVNTTLKALYQAVANDASVDADVRSKVQNILDNAFDGDTYKDFTRHSFNFYYLERGGNISYCRLKFNMDPLPKGALSVEKKTTNINTIYNNGVYEFTISGLDGDGASITAPFEYQIVNKATGISDGETHRTQNGKFTLTDGQIAVFTNIEAGNKIVVNETGGTLVYASECTVTGSATPEGGSNTSSGNMTFDKGDSHFEVLFTNTIATNDLSITKTLENNDNAPLTADTAYTVKVMIEGEPYTGAVTGSVTPPDADGQFTIKAGETALIENIPAGYSYEVTEIGTLTGDVYVPAGVTVPAGFEFRNVAYENEEGTLAADTEAKVKNTIVAVFGQLIITKDGIDELDHHAEDLPNKEEVQSSIFHITGTSSAGEEIDLIVTIPGNGSVTIKDIPVGTYTVTEKENWSWRYDADDDTKSAEITGGATTEVEFENTRTNPFWLSGDNYVKNSWNADSPIRYPWNS